jgi:hypothetical protein
MHFYLVYICATLAHALCNTDPCDICQVDVPAGHELDVLLSVQTASTAALLTAIATTDGCDRATPEFADDENVQVRDDIGPLPLSSPKPLAPQPQS